jgi:hypothetical protein
MQSGVRRSQDISQQKLKGMPKILGSMRSHQETVKQPPRKGMRPNRMEPNDGFCTGPPLPNEDRDTFEKTHGNPGKRMYELSISQKWVCMLIARKRGTIEKFGWGGRIRTFTVLINSEVSYQLDHAPAGVLRPLLPGRTTVPIPLWEGSATIGAAKGPSKIPRPCLKLLLQSKVGGKKLNLIFSGQHHIR